MSPSSFLLFTITSSEAHLPELCPTFINAAANMDPPDLSCFSLDLFALLSLACFRRKSSIMEGRCLRGKSSSVLRFSAFSAGWHRKSPILGWLSVVLCSSASRRLACGSLACSGVRSVWDILTSDRLWVLGRTSCTEQDSESSWDFPTPGVLLLNQDSVSSSLSAK